jgi:hypothetical protein
MQLVPDDGLVWVVVAGRGGGGAACVVGGGGGGAAWVVVVGGGAACVVIVTVFAGGGAVVVWVVAAVACGCGLALWDGLAGGFLAVVAVVELVGVVWVVLVVAGVLALWVVVEEAAPQALTSSASRMAAAGMRISFMSISLNPPGFFWLVPEDAARRRLLPEDLRGSEQPVNAPPADRFAAPALRQSPHGGPCPGLGARGRR